MKVGNCIQGSSLAVLSLPPGSNARDARRAYHDLLRQLHPDVGGNGGSQEQLTAVVDAYRHLERSGWLEANDHEAERRNGQLLDIRA
jgi:hypothetical protein